MVNVTLVEIGPVAIVSVECDQVARFPIGKFIRIGHAADDCRAPGPDGYASGGRRSARIGHLWIGAVNEFLQIGEAITIGIAIRTVTVVGDDLSGVKIVVTNRSIIEGIQTVLDFPAIRQSVPGRAGSARISLEADDVEPVSTRISTRAKDCVQLALVQSR